MKTVTKRNAIPLHLLHRKRVAAYARVSSGKDAMLESLSAQISYYSGYIQRHIDWDFAGVYVDEAVTGTKDTRKEFQRMLEDCRTGKIDMIVTKSVTRFARNTVTTLATARDLKLLGIDIYFEKENVHSISGDGEFMLSILAAYAQEESRNASERCKWRIRKMFQEGRPTFMRMQGYRLYEGKFYVVPSEAETVRQIFADYLGGLGKTAIAKKLNRMGVPTMYGGLWKVNSISHILSNDKYTGNMILQKTFRLDHITKKTCINNGELPMYQIENSHEAIIGQEMFEAVQREIERRAMLHRPLKVKPTYPFTGLICCGTCGTHYRHKITGAGSKYAKPVWICSTFNILGRECCDSQQIPENILLAKTAEVLGLATFNETAFADRISGIQVQDHNRLVFVFKDGHTVAVEWKHPSRRESWTPAMKQAARKKQLKINEKRRKTT